MNVFALCTGRCGSTSFIRAAAHISNYTSEHESRVTLIGDARLDYPANHIEADNRLTWMLGRLDERYGCNAFYVHLTRDADATARSFDKRWKLKHGIISAYRDGILSGAEGERMAFCTDYVATANANIRAFLKDKPLRMDFAAETALQDWPVFWARIGAKGDLTASLKEWSVRHNATADQPSLFRRGVRAAKRFLPS